MTPRAGMDGGVPESDQTGSGSAQTIYGAVYCAIALHLGQPAFGVRIAAI